MKRLILSLAACALIALSLTGCGALQTAQAPIGDQTVADARNALALAKSLYGASERLATEYVRRPACEKPNAPVLCSSLPVVDQMVKIRDAARAVIQANEPVIVNATGSSTALNEAVALVKAGSASMKAITDIYGRKS